MDSTSLIDWDKTHQRYLPWKETKDPYKIWISEIILQQTRVAQGLQYYTRFIERFSSVRDLAEAPLETVLKSWEGLGYYTRARNLHSAAKEVMKKHKGIFPSSYEDILNLKGIGPYTASAIASFAFDQPYAVLDGNVLRILSRHEASNKMVNDSKNRKYFQTLADEYLDLSQPAAFNQAIMNLGALICTPKNPKCTLCPIQQTCLAHLNNEVSKYPVKTKAKKKRERHFHYLIVHNQDQKIALFQRMQKDIWQGLYEFFLIEGDQARCEAFITDQLSEAKIGYVSDWYRQTLSHQHIHARFWNLHVETPKLYDFGRQVTWVNKNKLSIYALPKIIHCYLSDKTLTLNFRANSV